MTSSQKASHHAAPFGLAWLLGYVAFVVYGSLVPLEFQAVPLTAAWLKFQHMPMLELGVDSRADWVANGVLFFPIGFLAVDRLLGRNGASTAPLGRRVAALLSAALLAFLLAAGIEFTQIFFPARTVSLNDVLAECLGGLLGAAVALRHANWLRALAGAFGRKPAQIIGLALQSYLAAYLAYSLFPYDFLISAAELEAKLQSTQWAWWIAPDEFANGRLRLAARLLIETLAAAPFGILLARRNRQTPGLAAALGVGAALGLGIELAQFLTATGISQGLSIVTRAIGCGLGVTLWQMRSRFSEIRTAALLRRATLPLAPAYLLALAAFNGWFSHSWRGLEAALDALDSVRFMPFYYHYYTTESAALVSLVAVAGQYAPIALATWAWRQVPMMAGVLAMLLATVVESSRLFIVGTHADPTDILIAGVAGWLAGACLPRFMQALEAEARAPRNPPPSAAPDRTTTAAEAAIAPASLASVASPQEPAREIAGPGHVSIVAMLCTAALIAYFASHPLGMLWPIGAALAYFAFLRRWPQAWLITLPAMLPILDLAPWTGRFFFDEFDALILATVAVAGWRRPAKPLSWRAPGAAQLAFALFALSASAALLIGAWPYPLPDTNAFNNYHSPYNALRVAKGLLWALLLLPLLNRELHRDPQRAHRLFAAGMSMGALAAGASALWERLAYTGLFDFGQDYRVVGLFSGTHTGGAYLEAFLVAALPFAAWQLATTRRWTTRIIGLAALIVGSYAVMVTYARAGHIALAIALLVLAAGLMRSRIGNLGNLGGPASLRVGGAAALVLMLAGIAWPVLNGQFMQERIAKSRNDFHVRTAHWADAQRMMAADGPLTVLFGAGLGRYQETYFWKSAEDIHPSSYRLGTDGSTPHLALGAGSPLYVEQIVALRPAQHYRLTLSGRGSVGNAELGVSICEKWMLYSRNCIWHAVPIGNTGGQWRNSTLDIDATTLPEHPWYERPVVKLSFLNQAGGAAIDIRQISLQTAAGNEILRNGDFSRGLDRWFFSIDQDLPWHIENLWMQVYFEQGAVGLLLFLWLLAHLAIALMKRLRDPDLPIAALAAALAGYLTVGVVDSLFDSPRMALLFYMLLAFAVLHSRAGRSR